MLGASGGISSVEVVGADGQVIENLRHSPWGQNSSEMKWFTQTPGSAFGNNVTVRVRYSDGREETYPIQSGGARYEGSLGDTTSVQQAESSGVPGQFQPGQIGEFGVYPAYQGDNFPTPTFGTFKSIKSAPYQKTDPFDFASQYGDLTRNEIRKNLPLARDIAMEQLDVELQGLKSFAPAASALKRSETSLDNIFNQQQRLSQVESTLPGARESLAAQTGRAETYAGGRIPDAVQDRALELGIRSSAADTAYAGGFGSQSSVARKASDLLSAEQRLNLAQYGEGLLGSSITQRANLLLAPTQYSDAGSQIRVTPTLSGSQLAQSALSDINQQSLIPATTAYQGVINENQFGTNITQRTREFNATGNYNASIANANIANQFAETRFLYDTGYAGTVAGAAQNEINTQTALEQQRQTQDIFQDSKETTQDNNSIKDILGSVLGIGNLISDTFFKKPALTDIRPTGQPSATAESLENLPPIDLVSEPQFSQTEIDSDTAFALPDSGGDTEAFGGSFRSAGVPEEHIAQLRSFAQNTGTNLSSYVSPGFERQAARSLVGGAERVLNTAGMSYSPSQNSVPVGYDDSGRLLYSNKTLAASNDINVGRQFVDNLKSIIEPFGVLNDEDLKKLDKIATTASDAKTMANLNMWYAAGDIDSFVGELNRYYKALQPKTTQKSKGRRRERRKKAA